MTPRKSSPFNDDMKVFAREIEKLHSKHGSYLDSIMEWCSEHGGIEIEYAATLVRKCPQIRKSLKQEAVALRAVRE